MNAGLTLTAWLQLLGLLAVEMALVVGAAALISRFVASAAWRRTIWQVCVLSLLALTLSELTGTARGVVSWLAVKVSPENREGARPSAANRSNEQPASGQLTEGFRWKVADQLAQENQHTSVETAEATSLVNRPARTDIRPALAPAGTLPKQKPPSRAERGGDSVADSLAILWLGLIWLMGAGLVIARGCVAHALFALFRRHRQAVSDAELLGRVRALARLLRIARHVHLVESSWLAGPIVFGVFRPVIGLPTGFTGRFSPVQQEAMLAHELAHLAARDPVWYLLANWANAILWWHPLVWWARRQLHAASEMAADEASLIVVDGPVALAECLAEMGARLTQPRSFGWMGVEGNGLRSGLGRRVERLVHLRANSPSSPGRLRPAIAKILGPAALVATAILSTAWVGPQAFTKGESMKTMKQVWKSSLAAFALLTTLETDNPIALAANADERASEKKPTPEQATSPTVANKPVAPDRAAQSTTVPRSPQQDFYYRLMMERYGVMPPGAAPPVIDPSARKQRGPIVPKLEKIVLAEVAFDGLPLSEVLRFLDEESRKRDPEGINFLINPNTTQSAPASVIDPQTGLAIAGPPPEPMDMNSVIVRFNLPLRNVRLKDVLDAIVRVADKPIEYTIEEYGVVFSQSSSSSVGPSPALASKALEPAPLQVRTFKVDTEKLLPGMKRAFGINFERLPPDRPEIPSEATDQYRKVAAELDSLRKTETNLLTQFTGATTLEPEALRRLEGARIELESAYKALAEQLDKLKELAAQGPTTLRKSILTAINDEFLSQLMQQLSTTEVTLTSKSTVYGPNSPEIKQLAAMQVDLNNKVNDRIAGMLSGLEVNVAAKKAQLDSLARAVDGAKTNDVERSALSRPDVRKVREQIGEFDKQKRQLEQEYPQLAKSNASATAGDEHQIQLALRQLLVQLGIDLDAPGKLLVYNDLTSIVMVRATYDDLEIFKAAIETLGGSGIGQAASPASAQDGATQSMMRRYGLLPKSY